MRWRRWLLPAVAVLCVPMAIALAFFAVDVLRVGDSVDADDVRFQARPTLPSGLWDEPGLLPGAVASKAVGLEDDLRYRRAAWLYARANPSNTSVYLSPEQEALRASLEPKLIDASRAETDPRRRSRLLNLLGVVAMSRYAVDPGDRVNVVRAAIDSFGNAIKADPDNADAKFNLEIVLRDFFHQVAPASVPGPWPARRPRRGRRPRRLGLLENTGGADVPHSTGGDLRRLGAACRSASTGSASGAQARFAASCGSPRPRFAPGSR